jgi:hypothetical protein
MPERGLFRRKPLLLSHSSKTVDFILLKIVKAGITLEIELFGIKFDS